MADRSVLLEIHRQAAALRAAGRTPRFVRMDDPSLATLAGFASPYMRPSGRVLPVDAVVWGLPVLRWAGPGVRVEADDDA